MWHQISCFVWKLTTEWQYSVLSLHISISSPSSFLSPQPCFTPRSVHVLRRERPRCGHLQLGVRPAVHPQQLQGESSDHQDCGGGETLHSALWSSWRLAQAFGLLDDSGERNSLTHHFSVGQNYAAGNWANLFYWSVSTQFIMKLMHCDPRDLRSCKIIWNFSSHI